MIISGNSRQIRGHHSVTVDIGGFRHSLSHEEARELQKVLTSLVGQDDQAAMAVPQQMANFGNASFGKPTGGAPGR